MTSQKGPIPAQSPVATLGDVLAAVGTRQDLSETRRRDLRSAVNRVAALLGDAPERIPLVMPVDQRQASQAERGGCRRVGEDLSQSAVRFSGRREGERPPFGPPLRPGALEP